MADVTQHRQVNNPWQLGYLSKPAVTAAVENMNTEQEAKAAARVYQSHVV